MNRGSFSSPCSPISLPFHIVVPHTTSSTSLFSSCPRTMPLSFFAPRTFSCSNEFNWPSSAEWGSFVDFFKELPQFLVKIGPILSNLYGSDWESRLQGKELQANFVHLSLLCKAYCHNQSLANNPNVVVVDKI